VKIFSFRLSFILSQLGSEAASSPGSIPSISFVKSNALALSRQAAPDRRYCRQSQGTRESTNLPGSKSLEQFRAG
jgi:hypothetical protein